MATLRQSRRTSALLSDLLNRGVRLIGLGCEKPPGFEVAPSTFAFTIQHDKKPLQRLDIVISSP